MADIPRPSSRVGEDAIHEMENAIFKYASFVKMKGKKLLLPVRSKFMSGKIFRHEHSCQELPLSYDGVPFCICGGQVRECCYGSDRHRAEKSCSTIKKGNTGSVNRAVNGFIHCAWILMQRMSPPGTSAPVVSCYTYPWNRYISS